MLSSNLLIGPLSFSHHVQKINISEQKAVEVLKTTRSNKNFIVDNAESLQRAQIHFIFTGINEINTSLRSLIALFRCCPFISIRNEHISSSWKKPDPLINAEEKSTIKAKTSESFNKTQADPLNKKSTNIMSAYNKVVSTFNSLLPADKNAVTDDVSMILENKSRYYSEYIPVTLDSLEIQTIEDLPTAFSVILSISRIDVEPFTGSELYYSVENPLSVGSINPLNAFWLKKWINIILDSNIIPVLSENDFNSTDIVWYGETLAGYAIDKETRSNTKFVDRQLKINSTSTTKVVAESAAIHNFFGYHKLIGKGIPTAQHVGSSGRSYSLDLLFNIQESNSEYNTFCRFKETSDEIIRSVDRYNRINGWHVSSPVTKILSIFTDKSKINPKSIDGVYVPLNINIDTTELPGIKVAKVDMAENDISFLSQKEGALISGGLSVSDLKKYFVDILMAREKVYRSSISSDSLNASSGLAKGTSDNNYEEYSIVWPVVRNKVDGLELNGLINIDTLKAVYFYDTDVKNLLKEELVGTDARVIGNSLPSFIERYSINSVVLGQIFRIISTRSLVKKIKEKTNQFFSNLSEDDINEISQHIIYSLLGEHYGLFDIRKSSSKALLKLATSDVRFSNEFINTLFNVLVDRKKVPSEFKGVYNADGVEIAYYKLATNYILFIDSNPTFVSESKPTEVLSKNFRSSVYSDLLLPTYEQLYGDKWQQFALTYDDIGIINWSSTNSKINETSEDIQKEIAVMSSDTIEPYSFFYHKRYKPELKQAIQDGADISFDHLHGLTLSIPFNTHEIEEIEKILREREESKDPNYGTETLARIIKPVLIRYKASSESFENDMEALRKANTVDAKLLLEENGIRIFVNSSNNIAVPHKVTVSGLGGEIYRVAEEALLLNKSDYPELKNKLGASEGYRSAARYNEEEFIRHLNSNAISAVKTMINQIPDDYRSPAKMFPATKVYLIDKRGNDIFVDDLIADISSILSIDITQDKDDPDLAVVKIADPLFTLQQSLFPAGNVLSTVDKDGKSIKDKVYLSKNELYTRLKIAQGRGIQIRMGYTSCPKNLPIIFTGKITEIEPGEILTIVAQSWKAELVGRQVSFVNSDPKNWGAKDLAVQTIQEAAPEGIGSWYPQYSSEFILQNLSKLDAAEIVRNSIYNASDSNTVVGSYDYLTSLGNTVVTTLGLRSLDKSDQGIDTRLKNIWYPDTIKYNNFLGARSYFGWNPAFINDGWVVPLQPAWDVLKEASRHAWNCIVQVVPYDYESTLFFGHPDQPYYWTRGESIGKNRIKRYVEKVLKNNQGLTKSLKDSFKGSIYFNDNKPIKDIQSIIDLSIEKANIYTRGSDKTLNTFTLFNSYKSFLAAFEYVKSGDNTGKGGAFVRNARYNAIVNDIGKSGLPLVAFEDIKRKLGDNASAIILDISFGITPSSVQERWPTVDRDLEILLSANTEEIQSLKSRIESQVGNLGSMASNISVVYQVLDNIENQAKLESPRADDRFLRGPTVSYSLLGQLHSPLSNLIGSVTDQSVLSSLISIKNYISNKIKEGPTTVSGILAATSYIKIELSKLESALEDKNSIHKTHNSIIVEIINNDHILKAIVYYLNMFLSNSIEGRVIAKNIIDKYSNVLPPTMRTFRVIHWMDSDTDILQNNITASTSEMWNSVVVERPAQGEAYNIIGKSSDIVQENKYYSAIKWEYYPKNDITGVIGLQFHPGLTLANKKLNVVTELNCQSEELAAKLACVHLAEGIKRMYRGSLVVRGRNMKPYDRIILDDRYNQVSGPIEIESVVHHWNPSQGWISNIIPQAVCDANPGAAIIQTGLMEASFRRVFNTIDFAADAITILAIIGTLGAASPAAAGISSGVTNLAKTLVKKGILGAGKTVLTNTVGAAKVLGKDVILAAGMNPIAMISNLLKSRLGPSLKNIIAPQLIANNLDKISYLLFRLNTIPAYVENAGKVNQLPVILSPLVRNGIPFTAGLETDDALYSIFTNGIFYAFRDLQNSANKLLNELIGSDKISVY